MSHNKITVQGQNPDSSGNVSLSSLDIGDLNNVTVTTPSTDQVIKYDGAGWVNGAAPAGSAEYILIGQGESNAYSNSGAANLSAGTELRIYDTSPRNTITGATLTEYSTSDWYSSITLPAGKYYCIAQFNVEFTASGYFSIELVDESSGANYTMRAVIGENSATVIDGGSTTLTGVFELSSSDTLELRIQDVSNIDSIANQGNIISEQTYIYIQKVG